MESKKKTGRLLEMTGDYAYNVDTQVVFSAKVDLLVTVTVGLQRLHPLRQPYVTSHRHSTSRFCHTWLEFDISKTPLL